MYRNGERQNPATREDGRVFMRATLILFLHQVARISNRPAPKRSPQPRPVHESALSQEPLTLQALSRLQVALNLFVHFSAQQR